MKRMIQWSATAVGLLELHHQEASKSALAVHVPATGAARAGTEGSEAQPRPSQPSKHQEPQPYSTTTSDKYKVRKRTPQGVESITTTGVSSEKHVASQHDF